MAANLKADTGLHAQLRLRYRACWDAYQEIVFDKAELLKNGKQPSDDELSAEQAAATELEQARDELLAATSRQILGRAF